MPPRERKQIVQYTDETVHRITARVREPKEAMPRTTAADKKKLKKKKAGGAELRRDPRAVRRVRATVRPREGVQAPLAFSVVNRVCVAFLYGCTGCLIAKNGGFRPGQWLFSSYIAADLLWIALVPQAVRSSPPPYWANRTG
jgi:hypothetical protein